MIFTKVTKPSVTFFDFLPEDWKNELFPQWIKLHVNSTVYANFENEKLVNVGIIFNDVLPKLSSAEIVAKPFFKNALYIGYLFTHPDYRGKGIAKNWFESVKKQYPNKNFWLAIEDPGLLYFYKKLGFKKFLHPKLSTLPTQELILFYDPSDFTYSN